MATPIPGGQIGGGAGHTGLYEMILAPFLPVIGEFERFLSSSFGGMVMAQLSAAEFNKKWDAFVAQADEATQQTARMLSETIGIGGPTRQVRSDITDPESRAWIQERIDSGAAENEDWYDTLTEEAPQFPSAIAGAFEVSREGQRLGKEFFDPDAAVTRFEETFGDVVEGFEALPGQVAAGNEEVQQFFDNLRRQLDVGAANLATGFEDILGTATGLVSSLGQAERQDINRRFTEAGNESQMHLIERGLGGTGITSSMRAGVERERSTALLGLEEQIAQQQLGVQETFGLAGLGAEERMLAGQINLGGQQAGAMQFGNQLFTGTALSSLANLGNIAAGQFGAYDQAAMNRFNSFMAAAGYPIETQLAGAGLGLDFFGQQPLFPPSPPAQPSILPSFRIG